MECGTSSEGVSAEINHVSSELAAKTAKRSEIGRLTSSQQLPTRSQTVTSPVLSKLRKFNPAEKQQMQPCSR